MATVKKQNQAKKSSSIDEENEEEGGAVDILGGLWKLLKILFYIEIFVTVFTVVYLGVDGMVDIGCLMLDPHGINYYDCEVIDLPKPIEHAILWLWGNLQSARQML